MIPVESWTVRCTHGILILHALGTGALHGARPHATELIFQQATDRLRL